MSTIERALEKKRQLAENRRRLEQEQAAREASLRGDNDPTLVSQETASQGMSNPQLTATLSAQIQASAKVQVDTQQQAEEGKHTDPQVNIDIKRLESMGMVSPTENFTKIKEEYRYIKRPLLNNAFGPGSSTLDQPNLVMVSSSFRCDQTEHL